MNGEILSLKTAETLVKYQNLLIENLMLKNENKELKEQVNRLRNKIRRS